MLCPRIPMDFRHQDVKALHCPGCMSHDHLLPGLDTGLGKPGGCPGPRQKGSPKIVILIIIIIIIIPGQGGLILKVCPGPSGVSIRCCLLRRCRRWSSGWRSDIGDVYTWSVSRCFLPDQNRCSYAHAFLQVITDLHAPSQSIPAIQKTQAGLALNSQEKFLLHRVHSYIGYRWRGSYSSPCQSHTPDSLEDTTRTKPASTHSGL